MASTVYCNLKGSIKRLKDISLRKIITQHIDRNFVQTAPKFSAIENCPEISRRAVNDVRIVLCAMFPKFPNFLCKDFYMNSPREHTIV